MLSYDLLEKFDFFIDFLQVDIFLHFWFQGLHFFN